MPVPLGLLLVLLASNGFESSAASPLLEELISSETITPITSWSSSLSIFPPNEMVLIGTLVDSFDPIATTTPDFSTIASATQTESPAAWVELLPTITTTADFSTASSSTSSSTPLMMPAFNLPLGVPACYAGNVPFTQYWIPKENNWDENKEGKRIWLEKGGNEQLLDTNNATIAFVSKHTKDKCYLEGTCLLDNGNLINVEGGSERFRIIGQRGRSKNIFGFGNGRQNLTPFVSVASNDLPHGQTLFLPQLNGTRLANGMIHNGCVRVDDDGTSFDGCQLDFFVVSYLNYLVMELGNQAYMEFKQCTPLNYATEEMLRWLEADTTAVSHILTDERGDKDIKMVELNSKIELPKAVVI